MSTAIPIQNIYYLLSYAWEHFQEGDQIECVFRKWQWIGPGLDPDR